MCPCWIVEGAHKRRIIRRDYLNDQEAEGRRGGETSSEAPETDGLPETKGVTGRYVRVSAAFTADLEATVEGWRTAGNVI